MTLEDDEQIGLFSVNDSQIAGGYVDTAFTLHCAYNHDYTGGYAFLNRTNFVPPFSFSSGTGNINQTHRDMYLNSNIFNVYVGFYPKSTTYILDEDTTVDISLNGVFVAYHNMYNYSIPNYGGGSKYAASAFNPNKISQVLLRLYNSNSSHDINITDFLKINGDSFGIDAKNIDIPIDTESFDIIFTFPQDAIDLGTPHDYFTGWSNMAVFEGRFIESVLSIEEVDKNAGLLSGIIEWLKSIRDGIVNVGNGVTNVFNSIVELPDKLWNLIETGLKNLFVPSETAIADMKDKWDTLLADRFGVVYESGALVIDIANSVSEASTSETITFPSVSYNFSGTEFTFGGYEVDVIPNGFEFLADILKGVLDIVCTLAFINAMRRKYDELMMR